MCVGVTVWFGWGGVVSLCRLKQCFSLHQDDARSNKHIIAYMFRYSEVRSYTSLLTKMADNLVSIVTSFYGLGVPGFEYR